MSPALASPDRADPLALVPRPEPEWAKGKVTMAQYAMRWGVSYLTVKRWRRDKIIPVYKIRGIVRIDVAEADAQLKKGHEWRAKLQ